MQPHAKRIHARRTMITFNNFKLAAEGMGANITLPRGTIIYINKDFDLTEKYHGDILYEGFPIHHAQKSFQEKILCEIKFGQMFNHKHTLAKNMQSISKKLGSKCIWDLPLKYFDIPHSKWQIKPFNLDEHTLLQAESSILILTTKDVWHIRGVKSSFPTEKLISIIKSKASYGNGIVVYTGENLEIDNQLKIIL